MLFRSLMVGSFLAAIGRGRSLSMARNWIDAPGCAKLPKEVTSRSVDNSLDASVVVYVV